MVSSSDYYGNWPEANKIFRSVNCFQQVEHGSKNWNIVYCVDITILLCLSLMNFSLLFYLLVAQFKRLGCTLRAGTRISTSIILLGIIMNLGIFVRELLVPDLLGMGFEIILYTS
jgi:hypothetical protein